MCPKLGGLGHLAEVLQKPTGREEGNASVAFVLFSGSVVGLFSVSVESGTLGTSEGQRTVLTDESWLRGGSVALGGMRPWLSAPQSHGSTRNQWAVPVVEHLL